MMDFYFFLKTLILTVALVVVLQVKIGEETLEDQAVMVFRSSIVEEPIRKVAQGGAKLVRNVVKLTQEKINGAGSSEKEAEPTSKKKSGFRLNWDSQEN